MSETNDQDTEGRLSFGLRAGWNWAGRSMLVPVRQSFSHGRSKVVQVEVRKKRTAGRGRQPRRRGRRTGSARAAAPGAAAAVPAAGRLAPRALTATEQRCASGRW